MLQKSSSIWLILAILTAAPGGVHEASCAEPDSDVTATLSVEGMCCKKESKPAIAELMTVGGVRSASADIKAKLLIVEFEPGESYSPRALWEAAERVKKIRVVQLVTPNGTYNRKPRR